jgi:serine phosphatase RsbU (regulator of sigma subunit)
MPIVRSEENDCRARNGSQAMDRPSSILLCPADSTVTKNNSSYLKVIRESAPPAAPSQDEPLRSLPELLRAFQRATGWSLRYVPSPARTDTAQSWDAPTSPAETPVGHLELEPAKDRVEPQSRVERSKAQHLAAALASLLGETLRLQHALWQREAELAAGVPVVLAGGKEPHLATRLQAVLKAGAEAVGCQAAALYLLDEATSELKLRSCWGIPLSRLAAPARPLRGALADLEAMLGHAVVLEDDTLRDTWRVPEKFPAAVCLPVSSANTILGTLWFFSSQPRAFSEGQTNILEVTAGRIAADLEREMLLQEGLHGVRLKRQQAAAEQLQHDQLPGTPLEIPGWDLAGWTRAADGVSGELFDWFALDDGRAAMAIVQASGSAMQAALIAASTKAALRSHAEYLREPDRVLAATNRTLWTASSGDQQANIYYGLLDGSGRLSFGLAGPLEVFQVDAQGWHALGNGSPPAGEDPQREFSVRSLDLSSPGLFVVCTSGLLAAAPDGRPFGMAALAEATNGQLHGSARQLARLIQDGLYIHWGGQISSDATLLIAKRTAS